MDTFTWLVILVIISVIFDFLNGFNDSANMVATLIASRSMSARNALRMAALADFCGPFIFGVAVAKAVGNGIAVPQFINIQMLVAALLSACAWNIITWRKGIPSSSSHALIGGLTGALLIGAGAKAIIVNGLAKVFVALFFAPVIGLIAGWLMMKLTLRLLKGATPAANFFFKWGQVPTAITLALSHGTNDAQKTMGIITLALITTGQQYDFHVPYWVIFICAAAIGLGTFAGGWRIIKTVGTRFYKIKPIHSFTSQLSSAAVIIVSSLLGGPVSTSQVVSMSVMGAGAGERLSQVRWLVLREIALSWVLTIPVTILMAMPMYMIIRFIFN